MKRSIYDEIIQSKIFLIRGKKVMLDCDLAKLYGVETKYLIRQVRRHHERFPKEFLLLLTQQEVTNLKCQIGTSSWGGRRYLPYAFTEHGILMLSSVLNSKRAIQVNIQIMRTFMKLREILASHEKLREKIEAMERKYDAQFKGVFQAIKTLLNPSVKIKRRMIGFKPH